MSESKITQTAQRLQIDNFENNDIKISINVFPGPKRSIQTIPKDKHKWDKEELHEPGVK